MLKNMTRKGLALGTGLALVVTGFAAPANAVTASPLAGESLWSAYGSSSEMVGVAGHVFTLKFAGTVSAAGTLSLADSKTEIAGQVTLEVVPPSGSATPSTTVTASATAAPTVNTAVNAVIDLVDENGGAAPGDTSATDANGFIYLTVPEAITSSMQVKVFVTLDNGTRTETETVTFLPKKSVTASVSVDAFQTSAASTDVNAYWSLNGVNTANVVKSNFAYSADATPASTTPKEIGIALSAASDVTLQTAQSDATYEVASDRYKVVLRDAGANGFAAGDEIEMFLNIGADTNANIYFNADATAASSKRVLSATGSYDGMTIAVAQSSSIKHNDTATATSLIGAETVVAIEGTKTLNFTISLFDNFGTATEVAAGANHEVTVTLSDTANNDLGTTTITSEGRSLKATDVPNSISFTKKTNSVGQIAFAVTADKAADLEKFVITATGTISGVSIDSTTVQWREATWTVLPAVDGNFTIAPKGSLSLDYSVVDQFGNPANADYQLTFTRAAGAGDRDTAAEYANWSYVAPVSATGRASVTIVDNGAAVEGSDTVTVALQKKATAGGAFIAVAESVSDTFSITYENDIATLTSTAKVSYNGISNSAGTAVAPIYLETDPLVNYDSRLSTDKTAVNKWEANNVEADGVVADANDAADALLRLFGTVVTTNNAPVAGVAVRISGAGLNFADKSALADITRASNDSFVVFTDATGSYEAFVRSSVAGRQTISVDAQGAKSSVEVRFQESTGVATGLTLNAPSSVTPGARADFVAKVVDKFGKPVSGVAVNFKDNGPGVLSATSANTDPFGEASVTLTTLAAESGTTTVTAWATIGGQTVSVTKTITVGSAAGVTGKVNVGSFNGKLVVYASGLQGSTISWKVGGNWGKGVASSNYSIFNRPTPRAGVTVSVDVYVNGVKTLTKSVVTR